MKLLSAARKKINGALSDLCRVYHHALPIADINAILQPHALVTEEAIYCGRESRCTLEVGAENSVLVLSWYKHDTTGRYEINAYMS
jgi:hypothetical protein